MIVVLLIAHGLIAVALLGAVTHQAIALFAGHARRSDLFGRLTAVRVTSYTNAIVVCYAANFVLGAILYATYRVDVRPYLEDSGMLLVAGTFESKEHLAALGLGLLPAYWMFWNASDRFQNLSARKWITLLMTLFVWWNFLVGHIVNDVRGLLP